MKILKASLLVLSLFLVGCEPPNPHDDHGHAHTPHHGIVKPFQNGGEDAGFVELKLHDDKGDLELWLTQDEAGKNPYDLPLDAVITVEFPKLEKTVKLQVRNTSNNEDEDGKGNIRDGKTNYFIFPGDTGVDPAFLVGKEFSSSVVVSFEVEGNTLKTQSFELSPHTH